MATIDACTAALSELATRLSGADDRTKQAVVDRSLSCRITDLDVVFLGRLRGGGLHDIERAPAGQDGGAAQIRLTVNSDDLVALTDGELSLARAWATGRLKIAASVADLLRVRSLL